MSPHALTPRLALLALTAALATCAPESFTAQRAQAIQGGADDSTHTGVVGVRVQTGGATGTCSGTLLTPNLVLTARHCVSDLAAGAIACQDFVQAGTTYHTTLTQAPYAADHFAVTTAQNMFAAGVTYIPVTQVLIPANSTGVALCGHDIALLQLATPITDAVPVVPRLDLAPTMDEAYTLSGYGVTMPNEGTMTDQGRRHTRTDGVNLVALGPGYTAERILVLAAGELLLNTGSCEGDSGGPALDVAFNQVALLSRGAVDGCDTPSYTRVDAFAAFLRDSARAAAAAASLPLPSWVTPTPAHSVAFGEPCLGDNACTGDNACVLVASQWRCSSFDCNACPPGWACADSPSGTVCQPGAPVADAGPEAAAPDAAPEATADAGTTPPMPHGCGCATPGHTSQNTAGAVLLVAVGAVTGARRRSKRRAA